MKLLIKIIAALAKFALSESTYQRLRSFYYSLKRNRLSAEVEADGFIEWYAKQIDRNVPRMADRISNENIQTGQNDLKLLKKHSRLPINLEMALTDEMISISKRIKPNFICLVPEKRNEITTEGGLNLEKISKTVSGILPRRLLNGDNIMPSSMGDVTSKHFT